MKIKRVWAVYFSGTGTTQKIVTHIAERAAEELQVTCDIFDFTPKKAREGWPAFEEGDLVIMGTPVIAGRVPNVLLKYLATLPGNGAWGVPVVLYGNRNYDDALIELRDIMEDGGIRTIAGGAFIGEHSFSRVLGAGRPDEQDMENAATFAREIVQKVTTLTEQGVTPEEPVFVNGTLKPYRGYYQPRDRQGVGIDIRKVKPKTDEETCLQCGLCAEVCPMGSIDPMDVTSVTGICIKCCACTKRCPVGAKYYDDPGYLYHQHELEEMYAERRAEPEVFL